MESILISKVLVYVTRSEKAKGKFSVGLAVASRLNGDEELVGSFDEEDQANERRVGFLTFREKFQTEEAAEQFKQEMSKKYRPGCALDGRKWTWGRVDTETTELLGSDGAVVHLVKYTANEIKVSKEVVNSKANKELQFKGKVTEPVS